MKKKYIGIVISHTHWDRAWYLTFQQFRIRLVQTIDKLIEIFKTNPEYICFTFDGQTIVLKDYLEVKPENEEILKDLIKNNRILVGPWYILPDEFLVSGESLIRNLLLGHRIASEFGNVMKEGYIPDSFGHISQMPQILKGFGINSFIFSRGISEKTESFGSEFYWEAPDTSKVLAIYQRNAYCHLGSLGFDFIWGDYRFSKPDKDLALKRIEKEFESLTKVSNTPFLYFSNGCDHLPPQPEIPELIDYANKHLDYLKLKHGTIPEFVNLVKSSDSDLKTYRGELIGNIHNLILLSVYSTRMYLKQLNHLAQNMYEKYLEPLNAFNLINHGNDYSKYIWKGWESIIKNHPHDDISGCGIDEIHRDNVNNFDHALQIGNYVLNEVIIEFSKNINTKKQAGQPILIFNPNNWIVSDSLQIEILFDPDSPLRNNFTILDPEGKKVKFRVIESSPVFRMEFLKECNYDSVKVNLLCEDIPSVGYKTYYIVEGKEKSENKPQKHSNYIIENEYIRVKALSNGTLEIYDKETSEIYRDCNLFEDTEDIGDGYSYSFCRFTKTITSQKCKARIKIIDDNPVSIGFKIELKLKIPTEINKNRQSRSKKTKFIPITSYVTLSHGVKRVDIKTIVNNRVIDHRMRVLFPTKIKTNKCSADGHFCVVKRDAYYPKKPSYKNPFEHYSTRNQKAFISVSDTKNGLTIANKGLPEYEILSDYGNSVIAVTLFRSVGWLSRKDLITRPQHAGPSLETPESQCIGEQIFEYSIIPHKKDWLSSESYLHAYQFNSPLISFNIKKSDGILNDTLSFINIEPKELILSSIKKSEKDDGVIIRLYNIASYSVKGYLEFYKNLKKVFLTNLNEEVEKELQSIGNTKINVDVGCAEILTLKIYFY